MSDMLSDGNAESLADQIARAMPGTPIVAIQWVLKGIRDNATVGGIVREWIRRIDAEYEPDDYEDLSTAPNP